MLIPETSLKFTPPLVHLFRRTSTGVWFQIDSVHLNEPNLPIKMKKLKTNVIQLGAADLAALLVMPRGEVQFSQLASRARNRFILKRKVRSHVADLTANSAQDHVADWLVKEDRISIAAMPRPMIEEALLFATEHGFVSQAVIAASNSKSPGWIPIFWTDSLGWDSPTESHRKFLDPELLHMPVAKLPKSSLGT